MAEELSLVTIGAKAFAKCTSLRSFDIPGGVSEIGSNCFDKYLYLDQLKFVSSESLKQIVDDRLLDDVLYEFGVHINSSFFRIDVN
jgi:hypothetical protein